LKVLDRASQRGKAVEFEITSRFHGDQVSALAV
jgi:hypothetical protein